MRHQWTHGVLGVLVSMYGLGCGTPDSDEDKPKPDVPTYQEAGTWHPVTAFRDTSDTFVDPSTPDGQPEAGGWWVTPIHALLMPDTGKVLVTGWSRKDQDTCHVHGSTLPDGTTETHIGSRRNGTSWILDPEEIGTRASVAVQPLNEQPWVKGDVLYCSGHVPLADGRILYSGGALYENLGQSKTEAEFGLDYTRVFAPTQSSFSRVEQHFGGGPVYPPKAPPPAGEMPWPPLPVRLGMLDAERLHTLWYPTNMRLPDGRILISAGLTKCCDKADDRLNYYPNNSIHLFDPANLGSGNPISLLRSHDDSRPKITPGSKDYTHVLLLPRAATVKGAPYHVAMMGYRGKIMLFNYENGTFIEAPNGTRPLKEQTGEPPSAPLPESEWAWGWNATSVLLPSGEIMVFGGTSDKMVAQRADIYNPYTHAWRHINTGIGRENASSVLLPDGKVLILNGWADNQAAVEGPRRVPVLIDPDPAVIGDAQVRTLEAWPEADPERGYHSFALLLKDGRVLIAGGTHAPPASGPTAEIGCEQPTARLYSPPYPEGERPVLPAAGSATLRLKAGGPTVSITVSGGPLHAKHGVALLAPGATTHSFDQNQRYVPLKFTQQGDQLSVSPPTDTMEAPVGQYLLFLVNEKGTPSVGTLVQVE